MVLHLGQEKTVAMKDVVGIFDLESTTVYRTTRDFLASAQKNGQVTDVCQDIPKTFVLCREGGQQRVYISGFSSLYLQKKAEEFLKAEDVLKKV